MSADLDPVIIYAVPGHDIFHVKHDFFISNIFAQLRRLHNVWCYCVCARSFNTLGFLYVNMTMQNHVVI